MNKERNIQHIMHIQIKKGFVILYAMIIVNVFLMLTVSIANIAVKERQIGRQEHQSTGALYAAESGADCAAYWDLSFGGTQFSQPLYGTISCGGQVFTSQEIVPGNPSLGYRYQATIPHTSSGATSYVTVEKKPLETNIVAYGRSGSLGSAYAVERGLRIDYVDTSGGGASCNYDVSLVLDNSGSVDATGLANLKNAAKAIVDANSVTTQFNVINFNATAVLRQSFTDNKTNIKNAVDAITSASVDGTHLVGGMKLSRFKFPNRQPRTDYPDIMVLITDGEGNTCYDWYDSNPPETIYGRDTNACSDAEDEQNSEATIIKSNNIAVVVVGVGTVTGYDDYLRTTIASTEDDFYRVDSFADLEALTNKFDCDFFSRTVSNFNRKEI